MRATSIMLSSSEAARPLCSAVLGVDKDAGDCRHRRQDNADVLRPVQKDGLDKSPSKSFGNLTCGMGRLSYELILDRRNHDKRPHVALIMLKLAYFDTSIRANCKLGAMSGMGATLIQECTLPDSIVAYLSVPARVRLGYRISFWRVATSAMVHLDSEKPARS
jgi:hypothetical protein